MASSTAVVRISMFMLAGLLVLAQKFGFENFTGAFAAEMILGTATRGEHGSVLREKMETLSFGWFYPFFFVGAGNLPANMLKFAQALAPRNYA